MLATDFTAALIQTKLLRPPLPADMVERSHLTAYLNKQRQGRPLTLVSAPAGYGKSTLISSWLETVNCPTAWISLDKYDNEIGGFLHYFLAAIQTIFPDALLETEGMLLVTPMPPVMAIASRLINELNQIEEPYILVLDDYHQIVTQDIHDLLNEVLLHPPRHLHLVLGTRMDPLLPLVTLRANGQMTEIRIPDLRFSLDETQLRNRDTLQNKGDLTVDKPATYRIQVAGYLDESWSARLGGLEIRVSDQKGKTAVSTLSGRIIDQAALFGVLKALYDMRMPLLSVECQDVC